MLHQSSHTSYLFCSPTHVLATIQKYSVYWPVYEELLLLSVSIQSHFQKKALFYIGAHDLKPFVVAVSFLYTLIESQCDNAKL